MNRETLLLDRDFVYTLARSLISEADRAEDAAQETVAAAWLRPPREEHVRGWLRAVILNFYKSGARADARRADREHLAAKSNRIPSTAQVVEREEARRRVVEAVLALEEPYRSVILARYFNHLAPREISAELKIPVATIHTRLKRALQMLRARLGGECLLSLAPIAVLAPGSSLATISTTGAFFMMKSGKSMVAASAAVLLLMILLLRPWGGPPNLQKSGFPGDLAAAGDPVEHNKSAGDVSDARAASRVSTETLNLQISGRVVDRDGNGVARARVLAYPTMLQKAISLDAPPTENVTTRAATSGAKGEFTILLGDDAPHYHVFARAPGFEVGSSRDVRPGANITMIVDPCGSIEGLVRDRDGKGVANASIHYRAFADRIEIVKDAKSSADGSYKIEGALLPARRWGIWDERLTEEIFVTSKGFAPSAAKLFRDGTSPNLRQDLYLTKGYNIRGRVVDAETGSPIAGAGIVVRAFDDRKGLVWWKEVPPSYSLLDASLGETTSGDDGAFLISNIPTWGEFGKADFGTTISYIGAVAKGYVPRSENLRARVEDENTIEVELKCWPAGSIRGRVVDADGNPAKNTQIFLTSVDIPKGEYSWFNYDYVTPTHGVKTNAQGEYYIPAAATFTHKSNAFLLRIEERDWEPTEATVLVNAGIETLASDIIIKRRPYRLLNILVEDGAGEPVWGADIQFPGVSFSLARTDRNGRAVVTLSNNTVIKSDPYARPLVFVANAPGFASGVSRAVSSEIGETRNVNIILNAQRIIGGRVVDNSGAPVENALILIGNGAIPIDKVWVDFRKSAPMVMTEYGKVVSARDGTFEVKGLPDGPYHVLCRKWTEGGVEMKVSQSGVATNTRDLVLVLPVAPASQEPGGIVAGIVKDVATKRPIITFRAEIPNPKRGNTSFQGGTRVDLGPGVFECRGVPPGVHKLTIVADGYATKTIEGIEVNATKNAAPMAIWIDRGVELRGRIRGSYNSGFPDGIYIYKIEGESERHLGSSVVDDGKFTIKSLNAGEKVNVTAFSSSSKITYVLAGARATEQSRWTVPSDGAIVESEFEFIPLRKFTVQVECDRLRRESTEPAEYNKQNAASNIIIRDEKGIVVYRESRPADRKLEILLADGIYTLVAEVSGAIPTERKLTVSPGMEESLRWTIP